MPELMNLMTNNDVHAKTLEEAIINTADFKEPDIYLVSCEGHRLYTNR